MVVKHRSHRMSSRTSRRNKAPLTNPFPVVRRAALKNGECDEVSIKILVQAVYALHEGFKVHDANFKQLSRGAERALKRLDEGVSQERTKVNRAV